MGSVEVDCLQEVVMEFPSDGNQFCPIAKHRVSLIGMPSHSAFRALPPQQMQAQTDDARLQGSQSSQKIDLGMHSALEPSVHRGGEDRCYKCEQQSVRKWLHGFVLQKLENKSKYPYEYCSFSS